MRLAIAVVAAAAAMAVAGAAEAGRAKDEAGVAGPSAVGASVEIRDAVVRVTVIPEERNDVKVEFVTTNKDLPLRVSTSGALTTIDGGLGRRINDCHGRREHPTVWVRRVGSVEYKDMPQVVIRTPRDVVVDAGGAVFGVIGRAGSVDLHNSGCSAWTVADASGDVTLRESGAGDVRMGSAGRLSLHLSGAGEVRATQVRQGLDATLSGAGSVTINDLSGPLQAHVSGVGKIRVVDGHAGAVHASVSGLGSVDFGGRADSLDASISGIGSIRVKQVTGQVTKSVSGGGHVSVG